MNDETLGYKARAEQAAEADRQRQEAEKQAKGAYGTADFEKHSNLAKLGLYDGPIILGRSSEKKIIRYGGDSHLTTIAPSGSGKGVSSVIVNTLEYPGSLGVIDPKGSIAAMCARHCLKRGKVWIFDPFYEVKNPELQYLRVSFNPLSALDPRSPTLIDDVGLIAESVIIGESADNAYFSDIARSIFSAFVLNALANDAATMDTVLEAAFSSAKTFTEDVLPEMQASSAFNGLLQQLANQIEGLSGDSGQAVWSTLRRSLNVFQSPLIRAALAPSEVKFRRMKNEVVTVFLVLPATRLTRYGPWLRLMLSQMIAALLDSRQPDYPVLFLVDEASALGNLSVISDGIALFRGYHIKLWTYWQSLDQLQACYPDRWQTLLANSVKQVFAVNDINTAEYFSRYMGNQTRKVTSHSIGPDQLPGTSNLSHIQRPLRTPDEIMRLRADLQLLLLEGQFPIWADKLRYYADSEFAGKYDPDPYRAAPKEGAGRA